MNNIYGYYLNTIFETLSIENYAVIIHNRITTGQISKANINKIVPNLDYDGKNIICVFCQSIMSLPRCTRSSCLATRIVYIHCNLIIFLNAPHVIKTRVSGVGNCNFLLI